MRLTLDELKRHKGQFTMVDGCFDPLHVGHLRYFEEAKKLGLPVLCNFQSDRYIQTTKNRPTILPEEQRAYLLDSIKTIDHVHLCETTTADTLEALAPRFYAKGGDWKERGLPEREKEICRKLGIEIVYLDTVLDSSTALSKKFREAYKGPSQVDEFEKIVLGQKIVSDDHYDEHYFEGQWRTGGNDYSLETRRTIEGKNPQNIKDVFSPKRVLDLGCGPGALMHLMWELGVNCYGIDFSQGAKNKAPDSVRDRIHVGSVTEFHDFGEPFDLVVCRELLEHLTVLQVKQAVSAMARYSSRFVYVTTRFHPSPMSLLDVTDDKKTDPTHITVLNKDLLRTLFVLEGMKRRADLEQRLDWKNYGRVLVYEK